MIYLDNSASSFIKPKEVLRAVSDSLIHYSANPGRSGHKASIKTAMKIEETREHLLAHFNIENGNVVFTHNCTHALNLAILGSAKQGGHVICTENEHNSVLRPLEHLKNQGIIDYSVAFQERGNLGITLKDIKKHLLPNTYMIICNHISNVNGDKAQIKEIGKFCSDNEIIFLVDGAQSCGHEMIDMKENNINYLTFAGHKGFYAPQSIGGLVLDGKYIPEPILFGGTGTNSLELFQPEILPERLESGTIATPLILGLEAGITFVENNFKDIKNKIDDLCTYLNFELGKIGVKSYTQPENSNGVVAFNIKDMHSNEIANILNEKYDICVRGGYHCAPIKHKALGTIEKGAVRVSISYFNTFSDIQRLVFAVKRICKGI